LLQRSFDLLTSGEIGRLGPTAEGLKHGWGLGAGDTRLETSVAQKVGVDRAARGGDSERYLSGIRDALVGLAQEKRFQIELPASYVKLMEAVERRMMSAGAAPFLDWEDFEQEMLATSGLLTEAAYRTATQLLHDLGIVLWYDQTRGDRYADGQLAQDPKGSGGLAQRVFLDPQWVVDLLKPILGHRLDTQFQQLSEDRTMWTSRWQEECASIEQAVNWRMEMIK
jgi:hypothetical protein